MMPSHFAKPPSQAATFTRGLRTPCFLSSRRVDPSAVSIPTPRWRVVGARFPLIPAFARWLAPTPAFIASLGRTCHSLLVKIAVPLFLCLSFAAASAAACLGQTEASIQTETQTLRGVLQRIKHGDYTVIQIDRDDGTVIRQYINAKGLVFGIHWQAPSMPNLQLLLGSYFTEFQRARQARGHRSRSLVMQTKNLVVESIGHMRAFHGRVYLPSLLPASLTAAVVQ